MLQKCRGKRHKRRENSLENYVPDLNENEFDSKTFLIRQSKVMGRYMVANKELKPGSLILQEEPLVVGPCSGQSELICLGCYTNLEKDTTNRPIFRCIECGWPLCSQNCKGLHKKYGHTKTECMILKQTKSPEKSLETLRNYYNVIVPLRCLLLKQTRPEWYEILMTMESHNKIRMNLPNIWRNNQRNVVDRLVHEWKLHFNEDEIHTVCGILEVNAFEIGHRGASIRGVYPTAFLLSHDCIPNTTHTDEDFNYRLTIRASTLITANQPITLSYAYTLQGTLKRREHLLESKFFHCMCKRCSDPTDLGTNTSALLCPKCSSGLVLSTNSLDSNAEWCCNFCNDYKVVATSIKLLMDRIFEEIESIDANNIEGYETFLQRYRNVLHPSHYHCLNVKHSLSQLYGKINNFMIQQLPLNLLKRKRDLCQEILKIFDIIEPGYSRLRGVTLYELHAPLMILATRDFESGVITKGELKKRLKEVMRCLSESFVILSFEPDQSTEGIMANAAKVALNKMQDWEKILGKFY